MTGMRYVKLGRSGLEVSRICLGCMSYGAAGEGGHPWSLDEEAARPFFRQALELGINFFDTANMYGGGRSEEITGRCLREMSSRDDVVIATKVYSPMRPGPNGSGLSRKVIMTEIDHSLRRLGTDYVDLYQVHRFDPAVRLDETLEALHDVVKSGKARYVGASSMFAWQFAKSLFLADLHGWSRFVSMQDHYNILYREEERETIPLCIDQGVGVIPWSPLARGRLARPWGEETVRSSSDAFGRSLYDRGSEEQALVERVEDVARRHDAKMAQVALAWLLSKPAVTAPIVGATKPHHLDDAVDALELELSVEDVAMLEEPYRPREVRGHV